MPPLCSFAWPVEKERTETAMLLRNTLLYLPAQILAPLLQFLAILLWAWWLTPRDMGVFTIVAATQELGYLLFLSWFSAYALRFYDPTETGSDSASYHAAENIIILLAVLFNALLAFIIITRILDLRPDTTTLLAAGIFMAARSINTHLAERARAAHHIGAYTILQVCGPAVGLLAGALLQFIMPLNATVALAAYALAHVMAILLATPLIGMRPAPPRLAGPVLRRALAYGLPLLIAGGFSWVALNAVRYVAEGFEGAAAAGLIAVGLGLGVRGTTFAAMFVTAAAFPLAVRAWREEGPRAGMEQIARGGALVIAALAPAVAGLCAITPDVSSLLVPESYRLITEAVLPWAILTGAVRNLRSHFPDQIFLLAENSRTVTVIDGVDALATVAGALAGYLSAGLVGAVAGAAIGAVLAAAASFALAGRMPHFAFPWADTIRALIATAIMYVALLLVGQAGSIAMLVVRILFGAAVYGAVLAMLYPAETLSFLLGLKPERDWRKLFRREKTAGR